MSLFGKIIGFLSKKKGPLSAVASILVAIVLFFSGRLSGKHSQKKQDERERALDIEVIRQLQVRQEKSEQETREAKKYKQMLDAVLARNSQSQEESSADEAK